MVTRGERREAARRIRAMGPCSPTDLAEAIGFDRKELWSFSEVARRVADLIDPDAASTRMDVREFASMQTDVGNDAVRFTIHDVADCSSDGVSLAKGNMDDLGAKKVVGWDFRDGRMHLHVRR